MTSPFLVDNILHHQKTELHNQYINQQLENYVRQNYERSRDNTPEIDETKLPEADEENRADELADDTKLEDDDSKSRDEEYAVKNEVYYNNDYFQRNEENRSEKEVLNVPNLVRRCQTCGSFDCPPFSCKKSGIRRLEELEKRFNLNYQENSGDEADKQEGKAFTDELVRSCEDYNEPKKPMLKFSVSAILGEDNCMRNNSIGGELFEIFV
ncbi:unnamed protein product [Arctia plantaginis]|uniref:Uncharacterized protein n=1 Tax=Arctia plantaginis TaxID=874455 RepID=A0A8S1BGP1_ARCPL|nr:unnamed protein product [Arctia plantaginis]